MALAHLDSRISLWDSHTGACIGWLEGHFLHAAIGPLSRGATIGSYRLHFDDGTTAEQVLVAGEQIGDW